MDRSTSFGRTVRLLDDLPVLRYDRRGYGGSTDLGMADLDVHVADLIDIIADRPAVVVGHSLGGVIALVAAQRCPEVIRSVAAWEAPMPWAGWWPPSTAGGAAMDGAPQAENPVGHRGDRRELSAGDAAERFMRRMIGDERWARLPSRTRDARRSEGHALLADLRSLRTTQPPYDAAALVQPVVAGHGTASVPHHQRAARELARSAPFGRLVVVDEAAHGSHLTHAPAFASFVRAALAATVRTER